MGNLNFFLEKRRDKLSGEIISKNVPIFMDYNFNGRRMQFYTGFRIDADKWDDGLERTKDGTVIGERKHVGKVKRNVPGGVEINAELMKLAGKVKDISMKAKALKVPITAEYLRNELRTDSPNKKGKSVFDAYEQFIEERRTSQTESTIKKYRNTFNHFKEYCGKKLNLEFQDVSLTFLEKFKVYLVNEAGHTHNTVVKVLKTLKVFLNWADERNLPTNQEYRKLKVEGEKEPAVVYLTWKELMHLYSLKIKNPTLAQVRDVFCFGCFTGQRYSDIENLKPEHISDNIWINTPIKSHSSKPLYIPLTKHAQDILKRYKKLRTGKALPVISNQKMNDYLKELGKLAELKSPVTVYRFKGAKRIEKTIPKHDVLTTHVMRKTFVTNALSLGMQTATIKEFTGHSSDKILNRYLAVVTEDKIKAMELFNRRK